MMVKKRKSKFHSLSGFRDGQPGRPPLNEEKRYRWLKKIGFKTLAHEWPKLVVNRRLFEQMRTERDRSREECDHLRGRVDFLQSILSGVRLNGARLNVSFVVETEEEKARKENYLALMMIDDLGNLSLSEMDDLERTVFVAIDQPT